MMFDARPVALALLGLVAAWSLTANAQQVFRIVGPDGRVTFSDRPPPEGQAKTAAPVVSLSRGGASDAGLPFELRSVMNRYPVMLYSRPGCAPCDAGRNLLVSRGVPFSERTVTTQEDVDALSRLSGTASLPFATIGGQQLKGYSETEWSQFLDAAGYPKTSQLPATYRRPAATPLVAAQTARAGEAAAEEPAQGAAAPAPTPGISNPAGIRF